MSMSLVRSYMPEAVSDTVMYYAGMARCLIQYYINNTFSASEITSRLFVGDLASASNCDAMKEQGITHILSVINGAFPIFPKDFKYKIVHINDDPWVDIAKYFEESNQFIGEALSTPNTKVMIHCQRGVSRSVTLLLAYMILKQNEVKKIPKEIIGETVNKILAEVKAHRPIAEPNEGFMESLRLYVCRLNDYPVHLASSPVIEPLTESSIDVNKESNIDRTQMIEHVIPSDAYGDDDSEGTGQGDDASETSVSSSGSPQVSGSKENPVSSDSSI
ncbi:hypothetical protein YASMINEVIRUS_1318 [Yasminevirus sp. GU-2018]|uniref:Protein-tyrosine-phosphatase n=1 Tax=Yasminevirus sp. GU-2018 TaxID=2420051 RepID=A0A5K0UC19_9VIRU|nr:hypothetical protein YASMINEVIRUS_1318 [Yasminevirus sp. GU-2018]